MPGITEPKVDEYMLSLLPERDSVLQEMEAQAAKRDIPIVGPAVGCVLFQYARLLNAKKVFEVGSAIGYSTLWFARAVGEGGEVFYTDGDPKKAEEASGYFRRAGMAERIHVGVGDALEQLATMAWVAARTERLRLITSVMIVPQRNPVLTAKSLATIDVLSRGRVTVGVGVGWLREEFAALQAPSFERRGAVTDEYLRIFKTLLDELRRLTEAEGRNPASITVSCKAPLYDTALTGQALGDDGERRPFSGTSEQIREDVAAYEALGVSELIFDFRSKSLAESLERMEHLAETVGLAFRA